MTLFETNILVETMTTMDSYKTAIRQSKKIGRRILCVPMKLHQDAGHEPVNILDLMFLLLKITERVGMRPETKVLVLEKSISQ